MKKVIILLLAAMLLTLFGCGSVKSLGEVSGKTKISQLKGATDGKFELIDADRRYYELSKGATFFGLTGVECSVYTRADGTISFIRFKSVCRGSNVDAFDKMILSLTDANGRPEISRTGSVIHYEWGSYLTDKEYKWLRIFDEGQCDGDLCYLP